MSEKTDEINSQWDGAQSKWDNPKIMVVGTQITTTDNHDQLTTLLSRDIYVLDQVENNYDAVNTSISSLTSRIVVVENTTNELTKDVGDIIANGGGSGSGSNIGDPLTDSEIDEIWANA